MIAAHSASTLPKSTDIVDTIDEVLRHLDSETRMGVARMSVEMEDGKSAAGEVSHKCCNMYGRPASETVGLLDCSLPHMVVERGLVQVSPRGPIGAFIERIGNCYTDMNAGKPDNER